MSRSSETFLFTSLALLAFAANSVLTRLALASGDIDAASFTLVRLTAGAASLAMLSRMRSGDWTFVCGKDMGGPLALFGYAAAFSLAYVRIGAALGALVLFGVVQITMIGFGVARGDRPGWRTWLGVTVGVVGLAALSLRGGPRADPRGIALMGVAGISWGLYSLRGKGAADPIAANARNFLLSLPLALLLSAVSLRSAQVHPRGLALAVLSGAVTSGLGYAVWYRALRGLAATRAAIAQLSVPVIAAAGAVLLLGETVTARLVISGTVILAGVALALADRSHGAVRRTAPSPSATP